MLNEILDYETIDQISKYMYAFNEDIFTKYCTKYKDSNNILYMNMVKFNPFFIERHLSSVFKGEELMNFVQVFTKFDLKYEGIKADFASVFEHPMTENQINDFFENNLVSTRELNFSFSSVLLLMGLLSINLKSTQDADKNEKIRFFFEDILNLKRDDADLISERIEQEREEEEHDEALPESEKLNAAKNKKSYAKDDMDFLNEFFLSMDKILPAPNENVLDFANNYSSNKIFTIIKNEKIPKFPAEKLYNEMEEEREKQIAQKEALIIAKAKKTKKDPKKKDVNPYETKMGELLIATKNYCRYYF